MKRKPMIPMTPMIQRHVWLVLVVFAACKIASSATDREANEKEITALMEEHRKEDERLHHEWPVSEGERARALYDARFKGRVTPGVGCDACPALCYQWDLRPMEVDDFQRRYRDAIHKLETVDEYPESKFANFEFARLGCVAQAAGAPLHQAMAALTGPDEDINVRYWAACDLIMYDIDKQRGEAVLRELARHDHEKGLWAKDALKEYAEDDLLYAQEGWWVD